MMGTVKTVGTFFKQLSNRTAGGQMTVGHFNISIVK
jgi:hypothetical protein